MISPVVMQVKSLAAQCGAGKKNCVLLVVDGGHADAIERGEGELIRADGSDDSCDVAGRAQAPSWSSRFGIGVKVKPPGAARFNDMSDCSRLFRLKSRSSATGVPCVTVSGSAVVLKSTVDVEVTPVIWQICPTAQVPSGMAWFKDRHLGFEKVRIRSVYVPRRNGHFGEQIGVGLQLRDFESDGRIEHRDVTGCSTAPVIVIVNERSVTPLGGVIGDGQREWERSCLSPHRRRRRAVSCRIRSQEDAAQSQECQDATRNRMERSPRRISLTQRVESLEAIAQNDTEQSRSAGVPAGILRRGKLRVEG